MVSKLLLSNPYVLGGIMLLVVASYGAVGYKGYRAGVDHCVAEHAKLIDVEVRTRDAAIAGASEAIAKVEVRNVTIRQQAETIVREREVYRDCKMDADLLTLVDAALTGPPKDNP